MKLTAADGGGQRKPTNDNGKPKGEGRMTPDDTPYMPMDFCAEPMTMAELANCHDCRWLTTALGEFYMVHDHVWEQACQVSPRAIPRFLCIGCLEERLGRMLTPDDFMDCKLNDPDKPQGASSRLRKRLTGKAM